MRRGSVGTPTLIFTGIAVGTAVALAALLVVQRTLLRPPARSLPTTPPESTVVYQTGPVVSRPEHPQPAPGGSAVPAADLVKLQHLLETFVRRITGKVAVHLRIDGGGEAGVHAADEMPAASVIKLPLIAAVEAAWESGTLQQNSVDTERLRKAITVSDNAAADALMERVGIPRAETWLRRAGLRGTHLRHKMLASSRGGDNVVSAADMTSMLLQIARGELVSAAASTDMRTLLIDQTRRTRIPAGLPAGVVCGNKTGTLRGVVNDVAFVEIPNGRRYALAILVSNAGSDEATSREMARLSGEVYAVLAPTVPKAATSP